MTTLNRSIPPTIHWDARIAIPEFRTIPSSTSGGSYVFFADRTTPILEIRFLFRRFDTPNSNPLRAHATMDLLLRQTRRRNTEELLLALELQGARVRLAATRDYNIVSLRTAIPNLQASLTLLHEILFEPKFAETDLRQWCATNKADFLVNQEDPAYLAQRNLRPLLYGNNHLYGTLAKVTDFDTLTTDELRSYWQENIVANHPLVIIAGGTTPDLETKLLQEIDSWHFSQQTPPTTYGELKNERPQVATTPLSTGTQIPIYMGRRLPKRPFTDEYKLSVAVALLGGVFSSRLMQNLREDKGYTYGIRAGMSFYEEVGLLAIHTNVGNAYAQKALDEIRYELQQMVARPANEQELATLRGQLLGDALQAIDGVLDRANTLVTYDLPIADWHAHALRKIEAIQQTTADEITELAKKYFQPDAFSVSMAGDAPTLESLRW